MNKKLRLAAIIMAMSGLAVGTVSASETTTLTILHTNDVHGVVGGDIGYAKMATYVEQVREEGHVLVLDGGDLIQGDPFANLEMGHSMVPIVNLVGYDAMVVGNHEFDFGDENLFEIEEKLNFDMLSANIYKDGEHAFTPYMVKEFEDTKVGIFGMSTPETLYKTHPDHVAGYEFKDIVLSAQEMVDILQDEVDVVIMLAHLGEEGDHTSISVAENVEGIDLIVDGHSHTEYPEGLQVNDTLIVSSGEKLENIGEVQLTIEDGAVVDINARLLDAEYFADITPKVEIEDAIAEVEAKQEALLGEVIGETVVDLDGERETVRKGESNLGQFATDAMLEATGADVAITNGGGIRASIPVGDITMGDMVAVFPFGNVVEVKEMPGHEIVAALEHGVSTYPELNGGFPHTAGITFTLNAYEVPGNRISDVKVAGEPIEMDKMYEVATNDFMAAGGDGYTMFVDYEVIGSYNTLMDVLTEYVAEQGVIDVQVEERMTVVTEAPETSAPSDEVVESTPSNEAVALRAYAVSKQYSVHFDVASQTITLTKEDQQIVLTTADVVVKEGISYIDKDVIDALMN